MTTAIVTGANGFVGGALTRELLAAGYKVYAVDRAGCFSNLPTDSPVCHFVPCDMAAVAELSHHIPNGEVELFFHLAWAGVSDTSRGDASVQLRNVQWTVDALAVAKVLGCRRFVCAGSIMEAETLAATYTQGCRPGLGYIYGGGKAVAHAMCMSLAAAWGIDLVWPVLINTYGVGERSQRMVVTAIRKCIAGESPRFTAATQNYDFVYIDEVARAFRLIAERGKPFHEYVIGSGCARPLKEFLLEMKSAIAPDLDFIFGDIPFTGINLPLEKFDASVTERDTGFKASISFAEGCRRTYDWWRSQV